MSIGWCPHRDSNPSFGLERARPDAGYYGLLWDIPRVQDALNSLIADKPVALIAADRAGDLVRRAGDHGDDVIWLICMAIQAQAADTEI